MNRDGFKDELKALLDKHGVYLSGTIRLVDATDKWEAFDCAIEDSIQYGQITDRTGPFLVASIQEKPVEIDFVNGDACYVSSDYAGYDCPVTGKWIEGRAAHRENLKRHGCRLLEKGETRDAMKRREQELDRSIERTAEAIVSKYANYF